jgi:hypothetical protein
VHRVTGKDQIKAAVRELQASGSTEVTLELRPSAIPLVFGHDFDSGSNGTFARPGSQRAVEQMRQAFLQGRITEADDKEFKFQRSNGGLELSLYYDDVQSLTPPQVQPWRPPTRAEKAIENVISFPFRLIHALLLGGLCEW